MVEPARSAAAPSYRERLERVTFKRGLIVEWARIDVADGFTKLTLSLWERSYQPLRQIAITRRTEGFDEAAVAEDICDLLFRPALADG